MQFLPEPELTSASASKNRKSKEKNKKGKKLVPVLPPKGGPAVKGVRGEDAIPSRKSLSEFRVVQRNLVYVIGISARIAHENILKEPEFFGQYGKIIKIVVNRRNLTVDGSESVIGNGGMTSSSTSGPSASAYITFVRKEDAAKAIAGVDGSVFDGRVLRATYGTTKYCSFYLRGMQCTNAGCMYLHEEGENIDSFTKDELAAGKMHLHSYVLDSGEAAGMKQFGVIQPSKPPSGSTSAPPSRPASKPGTPVMQQQPMVFTDRTPSSFFERLSRLAAPHSLLDDGERPPGLASPPPVQLPPPRRLLVFDPFRPAEEHLRSIPQPISGNGSPPRVRPAPIGSPLSSSRHYGVEHTPAVLPFSESISSPTASRPHDPPHWLDSRPMAAPPSSQSLEPSVEQFFHLFAQGALGGPAAAPQQPAAVASAPPQDSTRSAAASIANTSSIATVPAQVAPSHTHHLDEQNSGLSGLTFTPETSIFEDPAILQARQANAHQRLIRPVPPPPPPPAPLHSTKQETTQPKPTMAHSTSFTTVGSTSKGSASSSAATKKTVGTPAGKKDEKGKQTGTKASAQPTLTATSPPALSQNAFMALLQESTSASSLPLTESSSSGNQQPMPSPVLASKTAVKSAKKKEQQQTTVQPPSESRASPTLATLDPAIVASSSRRTATSAPAPAVTGPPPYQRAKAIPVARKPDPSLLEPLHVDEATAQMDLEALQTRIAQLEAARRSNRADALQIEAFMRDLVRRSWPTSSSNKP